MIRDGFVLARDLWVFRLSMAFHWFALFMFGVTISEFGALGIFLSRTTMVLPFWSKAEDIYRNLTKVYHEAGSQKVVLIES